MQINGKKSQEQDGKRHHGYDGWEQSKPQGGVKQPTLVFKQEEIDAYIPKNRGSHRVRGTILSDSAPRNNNNSTDDSGSGARDHLRRRHAREGLHEVVRLGVLEVREASGDEHHDGENDAEVQVLDVLERSGARRRADWVGGQEKHVSRVGGGGA